MLFDEQTGLVVVDVQGKLARLVHESAACIENCRKLIAGMNVLQRPVIYLEQNPEKLGATVDDLQPLLTTARRITKFTFNACETPEFMQAIEENSVDIWLVCGIEAHICAYQTARGLQDAGYRVDAVSDAMSSRSATNRQIGIARLNQCGVGISSVEMCLYEMLKDCRSPAFKSILNLVK